MVSQGEWREELHRRRRQAWAIMERNECDSALVFGSGEHAQSFRYLTNFVPVLGDMWAIMAGPSHIECILTFHWQLDEARKRSGIDAWTGEFDPLPAVLDILSASSPKRVAVIELDRLPASAYVALTSGLPGVSLVDLGPEFTALRRRKSSLEVRLLREAARITDTALDQVRATLKPGLTEHEIAATIGYFIRGQGAELAFCPGVISGVDEPVIMRQPTGRHLQVGDTVMVDIGASYEGYQSDVSRTFVLGTPTPTQQKVWRTVLSAYNAALELARSGIPCNHLHAAAQKAIEDAGYRLLHRVGHGVGLATSYEWPSLDTETALLQEGMTLALEPGIYVQGAGSMKLEDDILITKDGPKNLSRSSHELIVHI